MAAELSFLLLVFFGLAALIVVAGTILSHFADVLSERTGVGRTLGGLLLLASATSLPELAVDCKAALIGQPDIAVGAVLGSSIFNLLIIGTLDLVLMTRDDRIISHRSAGHALAATATIILSATVVGFLAVKDLPVEWSPVSSISFGLGTLLAFVFYLFGLRVIYLDQLSDNVNEASSEHTSMTLSHALIGYALSTIVILVSASYMAPTAKGLAEATNLGGTFVGSTLVAITTSLPELVTTFAAVRMGAFDMAMGNILGSNAFNMAILFPVDLFYRHGSGSLLKDAEVSNALTGAAVIVITSILLTAILSKPRKQNVVLDPGAGLIVLLAASAFVLLYYLTPAAAG